MKHSDPSMVYISLLRGINVGKHHPLPMQQLKTLYQELGLTDVNTYIQSGNVVFRSNHTDAVQLAELISEQIKHTFHYDVPVLLFMLDEWKQIMKRQPWRDSPDKEEAFMHVTFFSTPPTDYQEELFLAKKADEEAIVFTEQAAYVYCPMGYGRTKLNNQFLESKLNVTATTRNWKTVQRLFEMGAGM